MHVREKRYIRMGSCNRCGKCCQADHLLAACTGSEKMILRVLTGRVTIDSDLKRVKCKHVWFKKGKAKCKIYSERPGFCRAHPTGLDDIVIGCGFSFKEICDDVKTQ